MVFSRREPIGDRRQDIRNAILCSLLANIYCNPEERQTPFDLRDFLPDFWDEAAASREEVDPDEIWANFETWAMTYGVKNDADTR